MKKKHLFILFFLLCAGVIAQEVTTIAATILDEETKKPLAFVNIGFAEKGIGTDIVYPYPLHLQPCFADRGYGVGSLPESEKLAKHCLSLPIVPELTDVPPITFFKRRS